MLTVADVWNDRSKDSDKKRPNQHDGFPSINHETLSNNFKVTCEALLINRFGTVAIGTFGVGPLYNHNASKPSISKTILDNAINGGGKVDDLVKLFSEDLKDDVRGITASLAVLLTDSTNRVLRSTKINPAASTSREAIMSEMSINMTEWVKEGFKQNGRKIEMFGLIMSKCDPRVREALDQNEDFAGIKERCDGVQLTLLIARMLSVSAYKHKNLSRSAVEKLYFTLYMKSTDTVFDFKKSFDDALLQWTANELTPIDAVDQARHFLDRLDMQKYGTHLMTLHNDTALDDAAFPKTLEQAYQWASRKVMFQAKPAQGSGKQIISLASTSEVKDGSEKKKKERDISKVKCFKCGKLGHYANECGKKEGIPKASTAAAATAEEDKPKKGKKKKSKKKKESVSSAAIVPSDTFFTFIGIQDQDADNRASMDGPYEADARRRPVANFIWSAANVNIDVPSDNDLPGLLPASIDSDGDDLYLHLPP